VLGTVLGTQRWLRLIPNVQSPPEGRPGGRVENLVHLVTLNLDLALVPGASIWLETEQRSGECQGLGLVVSASPLAICLPCVSDLSGLSLSFLL
jgi:hypothetical protein